MSRHRMHLARPSRAWINFPYTSFGASVVMVGGGILSLSLEWWIRACFAIVMAMALLSALTLAKTIRDAHETHRLIKGTKEASTSNC